MIRWLEAFEASALWLVWSGVTLALLTALGVVVDRLFYAAYAAHRRRVERRYEPLVAPALAGDAGARLAFSGVPARHRVIVAGLLLRPLVEDRTPARIAATRDVMRTMAILPLADAYLSSRVWWRRALALHVLGALQVTERAAEVVAALDDVNEDVRGAALDALGDLHDRRSLPAIVVRMHDPSLHRARRAAALAAFGSDAEAFVLDLSQVDEAHRLTYAKVLTVCGTAASRPTLRQWATDSRPEVRAAAFEALAHVGLDSESAALALRALAADQEPVRAMAVAALTGWGKTDESVSRVVAQHLDDSWPVALRAARALQAMPGAGASALAERARHPGLPGLLAKQMLWELRAQ